MIKASGRNHNGYPVYIFGLSDENLEALRAGKPIDIDLRAIGGRGNVVIFWGRTEEEMRAELLRVFSTANIVDTKNPNG